MSARPGTTSATPSTCASYRPDSLRACYLSAARRGADDYQIDSGALVQAEERLSNPEATPTKALTVPTATAMAITVKADRSGRRMVFLKTIVKKCISGFRARGLDIPSFGVASQHIDAAWETQAAQALAKTLFNLLSSGIPRYSGRWLA